MSSRVSLPADRSPAVDDRRKAEVHETDHSGVNPPRDVRSRDVPPSGIDHGQQTESEYHRYCRVLGIKVAKEGEKGETKTTSWGWWWLGSAKTLDGSPGSFYKLILDAYNNHSRQYWFIATLINTLYLLQIVIGAVATAISALKTPTVAVTVLTATGTVVAGVLAFLKSRGQPNRVRQLRNDLGRACDEARWWEMELQDPQCNVTALQAVAKVRTLYDNARVNAETNLPDTWSTAAAAPIPPPPADNSR